MTWIPQKRKVHDKKRPSAHREERFEARKARLRRFQDQTSEERLPKHKQG